MPNLIVLGSGPVDFTTASGIQLSIPLSALYFDSTGTIQTDKWPEWGSPVLTAKDKSGITNWLAYLVQQSLLVPGTAPLPPPAILIQAAEAGSSGNNIIVEIDTVTPGTPVGTTTANVTVTETDTYPGITIETVANVIGRTAGGGSQPGLVFLASPGDPTAVPTAGTFALAEQPPAGSGIFQHDFNNNFVVQARGTGADAGLTTVAISNVGGDGAFTLTATWKKPATPTPVALQDLEATFKYELDISAPQPAGFAVPSAGTVSLTGGSDAVSAVAAQATIVAAS